MDGNKDDALKCLRIGKDALHSGDRARALKFITKARRLDPSLPVDDLLSSLDIDKDKDAPFSSPPPDQGPTANPKEDEPKHRHRSKPTPLSSSASSSSATFSEEQITIVRQINRKKDYYDILGLKKSCTVEDVRKAYRKLSLRVHPDKNKAPGSEEAFKAVSKAFQCLSNEETRKKYDLTGTEEVVIERRTTTRRYQAAGGYNGYYDDFDPDEIFRQFFGGMPPATTAQFRTFNFGGGMGPRTGGVQGGSGVNLRILIQLLPVLIILLFQFLPTSEPIYALSRSYPYEYKFTTQRGVNYYVRSLNKFERDYPSGSRERLVLEGRVEKDYVQALAQNCRFELQRQQWGFVRETPHCDMLEQYQSGSEAYSSETEAAA